MRIRTGSEPATARSALRMRLWLSVWGLLWSAGGTAVFILVSAPAWAGLCAAIALIAATDLLVVVHRMRQGPHFQPGREVPPYPPVRAPLGPRHHVRH